MPSSTQPSALDPRSQPRLAAFYGGTFDPVHNGHLAIARAARDALDTAIRMMPAADPPHRGAPGVDAMQRAAMLELAVQDESGLCVDRRELQRAGRSYSIDTLRALRAEYGDEVPIVLLLGADSFRGLADWREWRALFEHAHFVVAARAGNPLDDALPAMLAEALAGRWCDTARTLRQSPAGRVLRLQQPLHQASASDIRRRIAAGLPWRDCVPPAVAGYIRQHELYLNGQVPHQPKF